MWLNDGMSCKKNTPVGGRSASSRTFVRKIGETTFVLWALRHRWHRQHAEDATRHTRISSLCSYNRGMYVQHILRYTKKIQFRVVYHSLYTYLCTNLGNCTPGPKKEREKKIASLCPAFSVQAQGYISPLCGSVGQ